MFNKINEPISVGISITIVILFSIVMFLLILLFIEKSNLVQPQVIYKCNLEKEKESISEGSFKTKSKYVSEEVLF